LDDSVQFSNVALSLQKKISTFTHGSVWFAIGKEVSESSHSSLNTKSPFPMGLSEAGEQVADVPCKYSTVAFLVHRLPKIGNAEISQINHETLFRLSWIKKLPNGVIVILSLVAQMTSPDLYFDLGWNFALLLSSWLGQFHFGELCATVSKSFNVFASYIKR
jgi:hypothetical protein